MEQDPKHASGEHSPDDSLEAGKPDHKRPAAWRVKWLLLLLITLSMGAADQASKHWAQTDLQYRLGRQTVLVEGYLAFTYVRNPGAAWGFLSRSSASFRKPFFTCVSIVAMFFILYLFVKLERGQWLLAVALSLVMGGAVGNFIDRLRYNYVIDFIDFHIKRSFRWPTFNVADVAITVGVIFLAIEMFVLPVVRRRKEGEVAPDTTELDPSASPASEEGERR